MESQRQPADLSAHLVVFGCGYLGRQVALGGIKRGRSVVALTRNPSTAADLASQGIKVVVADLASDTWHRQLRGRFESVVNCVSAGGGGWVGYRRSYVEGMNSIVAWARGTQGIGTFVYTSSTAVYPQGDGREVDELAATAGETERASLLLQAEADVRGSESPFGRWFILRLAGIYGPDRGGLIEQVRSGLASGVAGHHLNLIHRDDACAAVWAALDAPPAKANEVYNVADEGAATKGEIVRWLARRLGVPMPEFSGSASTDRAPVARDRIIASRKLRAELEWRPQYPTFREGYARILSR